MQSADVNPLGVLVIPDPQQARRLLVPRVADIAFLREAGVVVDDAKEPMDRGEMTPRHGRGAFLLGTNFDG
ncbi:MAG: hypothetical protein EBX39_13660 [Actinobacteria bacterium]|nr:hypothetical protein [Actinomycetota bacterium]